MTREWIAAYTGLLSHLRYRRMPAADRGGLLHVWLLATTTTPEATFKSLDELADTLELDGFDRGLAGRLVEAGWLDVDGSGRVLVHDWDDHQYAASKAIVRAWEADRLREWRRHRRESPPVPPSTRDDMTRDDMTGVRTPSYAVRTRTNGHSLKEGDEGWSEYAPAWTPFREAWCERFSYPPSEPQREALWPLVDSRPNDAAEWVRSARPKAPSFEVVSHVLQRWKAFAAGTASR